MRIKRGATTHRKHLAVRKAAKGMQHGRRRSYRMAKQALTRALQYSYRDRRNRKRDFRKLWITRINNAVREHGMTYGNFMSGLKTKNVNLDRKVLSELAVNEPSAFEHIVKIAKESK